MKMSDKAATAWSNLGRRKVRTALTSIGVIVGIMTVVTLVSLVNGVQMQVKTQFEKIGLDRVVVRPLSDGGGFNPFGMGERTKLITPADVKRWSTWPEVQKALPEIELPWSVVSKLKWHGKAKAVRITGVAGNPMRPFGGAPTALAGTIEVPEKRGEIVVNHGAWKRFKIEGETASEMLNQDVEIILQAPRGEKQTYRFKVVGISLGEEAAAQVSVGDRLAMKSWWNNEPDVLKAEGYDSVTLRAGDVTGAKSVVKRLRREKWEVLSIDALLDVADRIFSVITVMLSMVGGVALLVACIGIVNTMIMSIYERTREIGTLKAMGASRSDIRQMFMMEAGLIGLMGGAVGLLLSWLLGRGLNHAAAWFARVRHLTLPENFFIITPALAGEALLFAMLIGVLAGLYPANRAARLDPLTALRHE